MLTPSEKHQIESLEASKIRAELTARRDMWDERNAQRVETLERELRLKITEESWLEKSETERFNDLSRMAHEFDLEKQKEFACKTLEAGREDRDFSYSGHDYDR